VENLRKADDCLIFHQRVLWLLYPLSVLWLHKAGLGLVNNGHRSTLVGDQLLALASHILFNLLLKVLQVLVDLHFFVNFDGVLERLFHSFVSLFLFHYFLQLHLILLILVLLRLTSRWWLRNLGRHRGVLLLLGVVHVADLVCLDIADLLRLILF